VVRATRRASARRGRSRDSDFAAQRGRSTASTYSRRDFLNRSALTAGGAIAIGGLAACGDDEDEAAGYGELAPDPDGLIDLPEGFRYRVISEEGSKLSNGAPVPGHFDGMGAFAGRGDATILVRNHELFDGSEPPQGPAVQGRRPYDRGEQGGTTAIVVGADRRRMEEYVTSSGTRTNCAGGRTPWGTWLTCEEDRTEGHGFVFEVLPEESEHKLSRTPIREMGFFSHEAVGIDPHTGIVYLTEDDFRGQLDPMEPRRDTQESFLYRYIPNDQRRRPGALQEGGRLQALAIKQNSPVTDLIEQGRRFPIAWRDVPWEEAHEAALRVEAVRFNRLEGAFFAGGTFWFADTAGGEARLGQIYRYTPAADALELFFDGDDPAKMKSPDNVVVTPFGDLWFAEDSEEAGNRVMGITPDGSVYEFARNARDKAEFAGPTFSPDGRTFFVNLYTPGTTFAIWGPFEERNPGRQRQMAAAPPPPQLAPRTSEKLAEAAGRNGLSQLEALAYDRLGVAFT
jgi:uncharacterized protein